MLSLFTANLNPLPENFANCVLYDYKLLLKEK